MTGFAHSATTDSTTDSTADSTVRALLDTVASQDPTPGGGSVAALAGALGAALCTMVSRLTASRAPDDESGRGVAAMVERLETLRASLTEGVDRDAASYEGVIAAMRLPRETEEQKAARRQAIQAATRTATEVPLGTARQCVEVMEACLAAARDGFAGAVTDAGVGLLMGFAGVTGALYNVEINLSGLSDDAYAQAVREQMAVLRETAEALLDAGDAQVRRRMQG